MNNCLLKPHDGYTLIANATPHTHYAMGTAEWSPKDWDFIPTLGLVERKISQKG